MAKEKRLIDANAVDYENIMCSLSQLYWLNAIIENQPTVDAVEVVRCGKCLYYSETTGKDSGKPCGYGVCTKPFHITNIVVNEDFCSFGQRRADANMDGDGNA